MKRMHLVVGGIALSTVIASATGLYVWRRSPTYSLRKVALAVENRDRYEFEKYVDLDTMLESAAMDLAEGNPLLGAMGKAAVANLKPQIIKGIEDGKIDNDSRAGKQLEKLRHSLAVPQIEREGRNAYLAMDMQTAGGAPFVLKFHMTQVEDGYWRFDRIANFKELKATEAEEERLRKEAIAKANEEKLAKLRVVARLHTSVQSGWDRKNRIQIRFANTNDQEIISMAGRVRFPQQEYEAGIQGEIALPPGKADSFTWNMDVNRFIAPTVRVYQLGETEDFEVEVDSLTMADGTTVRRGSQDPQE